MSTPAQPVPRLLLLLVILVAFALFLQALPYQDIWWDEARNLDVALRPIPQIATAPELDIHPPLYFWFLHSWLRFTQVDLSQPPEWFAFAARFLSVIGGLCSVALLFPFGRRLHSPTAGLLAMFIAALSPFWLAESQEIRMYTISFALLTAAAWYLLRIVTQQAANRPSTLAPSPLPLSPSTIDHLPLTIDHLPLTIPPSPSPSTIDHLPLTIPPSPYPLFILLSTAALYVHYNAVFILVTWYIWWGLSALLAGDRSQSFWQRLRPPLFCGLATIVLILPIVPIALRQIPTYANPNLTIPSIGEYLWQNWHGYLGGYAFDDAILGGYGNHWLWLIFVVTIVGLMLPFVRQPHTFFVKEPTGYFLFAWLGGGLALYYIAVLDRGAFNVRYSSFVTPPLYLLLGIAFANGMQRWRLFLPIAVALFLIGVIPALHADLYDPRFAREDVGDLADWLRQSTGPDDLILVDQKYPFGFYYERYTIDANATPVGSEAAPARYLFVDVNTLDAVLTAWAGNAKRVFWVQWFESDTDPRHAVRFLLDIYGERAGERSFQGYDVDWWELMPPTQFQLPSTWVARSIRFGDAVQSVELAFPATITNEEKLPVAIRWQRVAGGTVDQPLKARVALYDSADNRLAQADERLLNDRHRLPAEWSEAEAPLNLYLLTLPTDLTPGVYDLRLLVYDADTLEPLSWLDVAGNPAGVEESLGQVALP